MICILLPHFLTAGHVDRLARHVTGCLRCEEYHHVGDIVVLAGTLHGHLIDIFLADFLFRDALANSYNIPPIQLLKDVGIPHFIATARKMGVDSLQTDIHRK